MLVAFSFCLKGLLREVRSGFRQEASARNERSLLLARVGGHSVRLSLNVLSAAFAAGGR
jgi:hypothetical protein